MRGRPNQNQSAFWDSLGIAASALCVIHCLLLPLLLILAPALAWRLWLSGLFVRSHYWIFALVSSSFLLAFVPAYLQHRQLRFLPFALSGITLVALGSFAATSWGHNAIIALNVSGGLLLIWAHWLNRRSCRGCAEHK